MGIESITNSTNQLNGFPQVFLGSFQLAGNMPCSEFVAFTLTGTETMGTQCSLNRPPSTSQNKIVKFDNMNVLSTINRLTVI